MKEKVLQALKPKVSSLGFSKDELEGVAETISTNLTDESTEEQINQAIDAVIPFLKVSQSMATRVINQQKKETSKKEETSKSEKKEEVSDPEEPAWFKTYREETDKKFSALIESKAKETRKAQFIQKLDGLSDAQKERKLKDFDRMSFKDDDDFTSYLTELEETVKAEIQEASNENLGKIGRPLSGKKNNGQATDDEVKEVINNLNI